MPESPSREAWRASGLASDAAMPLTSSHVDQHTDTPSPPGEQPISIRLIAEPVIVLRDLTDVVAEVVIHKLPVQPQTLRALPTRMMRTLLEAHAAYFRIEPNRSIKSSGPSSSAASPLTV